MSPKDFRNIWDRIFDYFEKLLQGMRKGDWVILFIILGAVFILSLWFGGTVGGFTFVLAIATIWNVKITQGLLRRSKEASMQSKVSFENDTFRRIIFSVSQLEAQLRIAATSNASIKRRCVDLALGMLGAIKKSDISTYGRIKEIMEKVWSKSRESLPIACIHQVLEELNGENVDKTKRPGQWTAGVQARKK